jgi:hypothetical protein
MFLWRILLQTPCLYALERIGLLNFFKQKRGEK